MGSWLIPKSQSIGAGGGFQCRCLAFEGPAINRFRTGAVPIVDWEEMATPFRIPVRTHQYCGFNEKTPLCTAIFKTGFPLAKASRRARTRVRCGKAAQEKPKAPLNVPRWGWLPSVLHWDRPPIVKWVWLKIIDTSNRWFPTKYDHSCGSFGTLILSHCQIVVHSDCQVELVRKSPG